MTPEVGSMMPKVSYLVLVVCWWLLVVVRDRCFHAFGLSARASRDAHRP